MPSLFQVLNDYELISGYQVDWLDGKEASKRESWQYLKGFLTLTRAFFLSQTLQRSGVTLSRGGLLLLTSAG